LYLTREEVWVQAGRAAEFERSRREFLGLLRTQPGFLRATLLNSLGYPSRFTTLVQWESRQHSREFDLSGALREFLGAHPPAEISAPARPVEAYEVIHRIRGKGRPEADYLIDEVVRPGPTTLQEFEESRGAVYELRRRAGTGFAISLLSRFLGGANRYLIFGGFNAEGDDRRTAEAPEIVRYWQEHPDAQTLVPSAIRDPQMLVMSEGEEPI
jgi:heme-degrading monooxygenase HmoA